MDSFPVMENKNCVTETLKSALKTIFHVYSNIERMNFFSQINHIQMPRTLNV